MDRESSSQSRDAMKSPPPHAPRSKDDVLDRHTFPWERGSQRSCSDDGEAPSDDNDTNGLGIMEAFENFNRQAEKRVKELLEATDVKLFAESSDTADPTDAPPPDTPSYILLSDQYRLARPPQFHHWRQSFSYLQVTGKSSFDEVPDEHIQIRPGPPPSAAAVARTVCNGGDEQEMAVVGKAMRLEIDTSDPPQEELIVADGEMEEVVEDDRVSDPNGSGLADGNDSSSERGEDEKRPPTGALSCVSPRTSQAEEAVDQLTIEWYSEMVPSLCSAVFERLLQQQQLRLRIARETYEEEVHVAHEKAVAAREEELRTQEQEYQERVMHEAALAQAEEEERVREEVRRQEVLRQLLEENDEEEIKIRTLAYSHTREWYQPTKKCFSHRGRQLTYLKPVLKASGQSDQNDTLSADTALDGDVEERPKPRSSVLLPRKPASSKRAHRHRRISSPSELDIRSAKSPTASPQTSPPSEMNRPSSKPTTTASRLGVQLPLLDKTAVNREVSQPQQSTKKPPRKRSWRGERSPPALTPHVSATVAAPSRVYNISPYRIPPAILKSDLKKDATAMRKRRHQRQAERESGSTTSVPNEQGM